MQNQRHGRPEWNPESLLLDDCPLQIPGRLRLPARGYLDVIDDLDRSGGTRHPCRRSLMLHDFRGPFPGHDPTLHMKAEPISSDLRFGQFRSNGSLNLRIAGGNGSLNARRRPSGACNRRHGKDRRKKRSYKKNE